MLPATPASVRPVFSPHLEGSLMSCLAKMVGPAGAVLGAILTTLAGLPALAQSDDQGEGESRGVRIIDAPTPPGSGGPSLKSSGTEAATPPVLTPAMPPAAPLAPTLTPPPAAAAQPLLTAPPPVVGETRPAAPVLVPPTPELRPAAEAAVPPTVARPNSVLGGGASV